MLTLNEDQSAALLTSKLKRRGPFYFIKLGDAAVELLNGFGKSTCDGELYLPSLAHGLFNAWQDLALHSDLVVGDWRTASFSGPNDKSRYDAEYAKLLAIVYPTALVHFECLLLMRESQELLDFYRTVRKDGRRKLLLGPADWEPIANLLLCDFIGLPVMANLIDIVPQVAAELKTRDFEILLYGAGMAGHVAVVDCWKALPLRTYINLGSALDPATARGKTRKQQLQPNAARAFLERVRGEVISTAARGDTLLKAYLADRDLL